MIISPEDLQSISGMKMLLEIETGSTQSLQWIKSNRELLEQIVSANGALLIRGLNPGSDGDFADILTNLFDEPLVSYTYRSTPRTELQNKIYTATEYHASEWIPQHNENSYSNTWPMRIAFLCVKKATSMGNTPISDSRVVYRQIPREIVEEFERKRIMYVRNYSDIDLPWQEVFQTDSKEQVEKYCVENSIQFEWTPLGLRTKQINQASLYHQVTRERVWFNQAHLFHVSNLQEELQEGLLELLGEDNLPRNTYFGDGTPIDREALSVIRKVYDSTKFSFQWQENDLLILDNMLFTHGREPYEGPRKVLVGMARSYSAVDNPAESVIRA